MTSIPNPAHQPSNYIRINYLEFIYPGQEDDIVISKTLILTANITDLNRKWMKWFCLKEHYYEKMTDPNGLTIMALNHINLV